MMRLLLRLCVIPLLILFIGTIVFFPIGLFICTPVYWIITGRDYWDDVMDALEYCTD